MKADYFTVEELPRLSASLELPIACAGAKEGSDGEVSFSPHTAVLTQPAVAAGGEEVPLAWDT